MEVEFLVEEDVGTVGVHHQGGLRVILVCCGWKKMS